MTGSPSKYLAAFASTHELMLLQRRAADTLQRMQYALLQQHLTPLADLHGPDAQRRLKDLFREIHEKKPADLLVFLQKLAGDGPFQRWNPAYPDPDWKLRTPGTELIRTLVNQTLLTLASLQENNKNVDSPSPDSL